MEQDNWKHRSKMMKCESCMWFVRKVLENEAGAPTTSRSSVLGRCRKHAPTITGFPAVFASDYCGDHKLDENKI